MLVYLLIDLVVIMIGVETYQKTKKNWALVLSCVMLVFFAGLRGEFTSDYQSYSDYFLKISRNVKLLEILSPFRRFSMEKGFVLLCKLIGFVTDSPVVFFTIVSALTLSLYFCGFKKLSAMPVLSVLLFVGVGDYYATYNLVRQTLAAAIVFYGLSLWAQNKRIKFFLCLGIATLLHRTSLIVLPLVFLLEIKICTRNVVIISCVGILASVVLSPIVKLGQSLFAMYENYSYGMGEGTINAVIPQLAMLAFVAYSVLLTDCDFDVHDRRNRMLINASIFSTIMMFMGMRIYILSRFAYYLKPAFWVLVPNVIASYSKETDRRIVLVIVSLLSVAFTWVTLSGTGYEPYYFYFQ